MMPRREDAVPQAKKFYNAIRKDGQPGHVAGTLNGVAMFVPWLTGIAELHLVEDLQEVQNNG